MQVTEVVSGEFNADEEQEIMRLVNDLQNRFADHKLSIIYASLCTLLGACLIRMSEGTEAPLRNQLVLTGVNINNSVQFLMEQENEAGKGVPRQ
jgi:hypothetical protein